VVRLWSGSSPEAAGRELLSKLADNIAFD
jgi:hypothetical protein